MSARISVIVPAYNRAALIGETLECLLRQTLPPHELLVVDDGSTDDTVAVVRGFGDRVQLIPQANAGPGAARNAALVRATGEFVQFFDSDDLVTADKLELSARALAESGADVAYCAWTPAWFEANRVKIGRLAFQQSAVPVDELSAFLRRWIVFMPACLVRRALLAKVGGYPTAARTGEDLELLLRMIVSGARFVHVPGPLMLVRQHPEGQLSASADLAAMRARDRVWLMTQTEALLDRAGARVRPYDKLLWRADRWNAMKHDAVASADPTRVGFHPFFAAIVRARQVTAGLRAKTGGIRQGPFYRAAPITESQCQAVRALGYEPAWD